jgi:beta-xylosidase
MAWITRDRSAAARHGVWRRRGVVAIVAATFGVALAPVTAEGGRTTTPEPSFERLDVRRPDGTPVALADPDVMEVDGTWYLSGTTSTDGFELWSSTDLTTWTYEGLAWTPTPGSWNDGQRGYWAPDLFAAPDGAFWLTYTANQRIGVAKATSPTGPYVDQLEHPLVGNGYGGVGDGKLSGGTGLFDDLDDKAIDADLFQASDGSLYLYFAQQTPFSQLSVLPMSDPTTPVGAPVTALPWEGALETWEWWIREAPHVIEHDGTIHLMYSGHDYASSCYSVGVATASDPLGPFTRRADNPILSDDPDRGFYGPGHHTVTDDGQGGLTAVFHVKESGDYGSARVPGRSPLVFDEAGQIDILAPGNTAGIDPTCLRPTGAPTTTTTTSDTTVPTGAPASPAPPPATPMPGAAAYTG